MRGILCMMGGYCTDQAGDCTKMYDPINNNVYLTRDVLWLNRIYFDKDGEVDSLPDVSADAVPAALALTQVPDTQVVPWRTNKTSKKKSISFSVPNGENGSVVSSVVSREIQYTSFKTENDTTFEVDDTSEVSGDDEVNIDDKDSTSSEEEIIEGTTRSGRSFKNLWSIDKPSRSSDHRGRKARHSTRKEVLLAQLSKRLTPAEVKFYNDMKDLKELSLLCADMPSEVARAVETGLVGAAGNEFGNTAELNVLNYKQSMESLYSEKYVEGIDEEQYKMPRNEVFEEVNIDDIPPGTKLLDSTCANKLKADGSTRCRLAIRGFQQIDGVYFDASDKAAPVVCDVTIRVVLILAIMANWLA
jgi:hypothetical protein